MCCNYTYVPFGNSVTKGNATRNSFISNTVKLAMVLPELEECHLGTSETNAMRYINRLRRLVVGVAVFSTGLSPLSAPASAEQAQNPDEQISRAQAAAQLSPRVAETVSNNNNEDWRKIDEARQCVRQHRDGQALKLLREVLAHDPSNREARMETALVLGYREDYGNSDRMYRALLVENPADEAAAVGLIHNLMKEGRSNQARTELRKALALNPNSLLLQEFSDLQSNGPLPAAEIEVHKASVKVGGSYFSDSAGNRAIEATQAAQYGITQSMIGRLRTSQQKLWNQTSDTANVLVGTGGFEIRPCRFLSIFADGGAVHFADLSSRSIYVGDVSVRPVRTLLLTGGFSRFPISPTYDATQFDLLGEGWHAGLDWHPKFVRIRGSFSQAHYSDGNRAETERGEIIHWTGGSSVAFGAGYEFSHRHFLFDPLHGYFSPDEYRRHLGELGIRFRIGKTFRAEYLGRGGGESISNRSFTPAGELRLKHRIYIQRWAGGLDYSRFQVTQSTGAFGANSVSGFLGYDF